MKRILILAMATVLGTTFGWAQTLESIKTVVMLGQLEKAKTDFDKAAANPKFMGKAEAYLLKTAIYAGLSMTDQNRNTANGNALVTDADAAFDKYKAMEPEMTKFGEESVYQNGPINIYSNYYNQGLASYNEKKWNEAIPALKKAIGYSDFLIGKKLLPFPLDTNLLILTGVVGERSKDEEVTTMAYNRLVNAQVFGPDFEGVYQYLVRYYFQKKDLTNFEKIKTQGAKLYPNSDFFQLDRLDFAVGLVDDFNDKLKALNEMIAIEPDNYKAHELRWAIIYDTLNSYEEGAVKPTNAIELENLMLTSMKKCSVLKPQEVKNFLFLGAFYVGRKEAANDARIKFAEELQKKTKPGTKALPADIAKRDQLDKEYYQTLEFILDPYLSAAGIYAAKTHLDAREKQQYKNIAGYLAEIFETKKKRAPKDKPAEIAKWTAEEKKWNDVYESIK